VEIRTRTCTLPFSIMGSHETFGQHVSENESRFYDWTDGLNMLKGNHVATKQTDAFVEALTDISLKIKLLGRFLDVFTGFWITQRSLLIRPIRREG